MMRDGMLKVGCDCPCRGDVEGRHVFVPDQGYECSFCGRQFVVAFVVWGRPQQVGSKIAQVITRGDGEVVVGKGGRPVTVSRDSNKQAAPWMRQVAQAAGEAMGGRELLTGPVTLSAVFRFSRGKGHFGTGRNAGRLKASAPREHVQSPDLAKLVRAIEDGMSGVVYVDDRQIHAYRSIGRLWTTGPACAEVLVDRQ